MRVRTRLQTTSPRRSSDSTEAPKAPVVGSIGLAVAELTDAQKREAKLKGGVRVETAEGIAARAGIREGDVIVTVDNVEVTGVKQFEAAMAKVDKTKPLSMLVRRGDAANFIIVRPTPRG